MTLTLMALTRAALIQDITRLKKRLAGNWKRNGAYENFGQKEVRDLQDKHDYLSLKWGSPEQRQMAQMIDNFTNWCIEYCGN